MDRNRLNGIEIGSRIYINISDAGFWIIQSEEEVFSLEDMTDFFRAWLLLERKFPDAKLAIDRLSINGNPVTPFSYWKLVGSAIKAKSAQWTDRAMNWIPFLPSSEKILLEDLLVEVRESKWASQKSRQLSRRYLNEIEVFLKQCY
ncbi:hypothetical protein [Sphingomonas sp. VNH70]|uniref:hypothetical protein n=1 Tax=Sphingomonas silueang TaxID=3156617 RepID=UPI0032B395DE